VSKPKMSDVAYITVTLVPATYCAPPEGRKCFLQNATPHMSASDAKRHALENPGHVVYRESVTRSTYHWDGEEVPES
jgi:hypothetical protein